MRVILKPGGLLLLLTTLLGLAALSVFLWTRLGSAAGATAGGDAAARPLGALPPLAETAAPPPSNAPAASGLLSNADFEGEYRALPPPADPNGKVKVSGAVAEGWNDSSDWGNVRVRYAEELTPGATHSGKSCQRADVDSVVFGAFQFEQHLKLTAGRHYRASLWARASRPVKAELWFRHPTKPSEALKVEYVNISKAWRRFTIEAALPADVDAAVLMLAVKRGGVTLWVDDAALEEVRPSY
jgi:hypothetical protein